MPLMKYFKDFLNSIPHKFKADEEAVIQRAYEFAQKAHHGQKRKSGEDYFIHGREAAIILGQLFPDVPTLAATLLHDVPEDTTVTLENITELFGEEIARLIDGVTQLGHVRMKNSKDKFYVENLRKLFIATSQDIRVILIKLSDRMHNMRTIEFIPPEKQIKVAKETLEIYAPIAGRLGIGNWKDELEDLSFKIVFPKEYASTKELLDKELESREEGNKDMQKNLTHILRTEGIKFQDVTGRVKRLYSLFRKLEKYEGDITKIHDFIALRIITKSTSDCYAALGVIHKHFQPVPGRIKDFIANPKPNGYQSIHTTVFGSNGKTFEIQIRTDLMHEEAERGVAAHWFYAEEGKPESAGRLQAKWIKELQSWQEETTNPDEFLESLKIDFFRDRIFVFTPKGDIKDLPQGSSVIDFAFAVHTDLGYHMMGAKINGKMRSIYDQLENEDVVEIIKTKKEAVISRDWLKAAKTHSARNKIRHYLTEHDSGILQRIKELKLKDFTLPKFFRKK
ncbi:MAG: bifunctional (p)ppGpp synthetase/guanosine-3',5'-bis(diphosphate) 3'-pyrophosphohydrolase [Candidatus Doudnabacteria bacterium]|nr:bifunctional (p)ppGpp synthetase/guanosine-3',5'-bis(diphosphate) 3'-pyrophosphohydrolase [Candidatus Doudnabacteria bacterium]